MQSIRALKRHYLTLLFERMHTESYCKTSSELVILVEWTFTTAILIDVFVHTEAATLSWWAHWSFTLNTNSWSESQRTEVNLLRRLTSAEHWKQTTVSLSHPRTIHNYSYELSLRAPLRNKNNANVHQMLSLRETYHTHVCLVILANVVLFLRYLEHKDQAM